MGRMPDFGGLDRARAAATRRQRARGRRTRQGRNASSPLRCDGGRLALLRPPSPRSCCCVARRAQSTPRPAGRSQLPAASLAGQARCPAAPLLRRLRRPSAKAACCLAPASLPLPPPSPRACCGCWPSGRHSNNLSREGPQGSARASAGCGVPPAAVRRGQPSSRAGEPPSNDCRSSTLLSVLHCCYNSRRSCCRVALSRRAPRSTPTTTSLCRVLPPAPQRRRRGSEASG